jgi:predicted metal-dependent HD superfamily phosphohydrolase
MMYDQILDAIKEEVTRFYKINHEKGFGYHNLSHTESVVNSAVEIGAHYGLNEKDMFIVEAAAWFHDTGYYNGGAIDHELRGADKAAFFLQEKGVEEDTIKSVRRCIMATHVPQKPHTLLEQIVCDADLFHLGTDQFGVQNKLMRKEIEWREDRKVSKDEWRNNTILFLESHRYHTDYARNLLTEKKNLHLEERKRKNGENRVSIKEMKLDSPSKQKKSDMTAPLAIQQTPVAQETPGKKQKSDRPERGIETMFRVSSNNHQRLSDMADNKAHIMITTTSIIISVLLSLLLRKLEDNPHLLVPTMVLLAVCVVTMVFCILATRPALPKGTFTPQDLSSKKVNLLFFGNFYKMSYDEYENGMKQVMNDRDFLYGSLTRDVYSQGIVLGRKYRLLRKGYNIFMYGVVISVLSFLIAVTFFK